MSLVPVLERIEALDVASLEVGGVGLALADITQVQRYLDAVKVRLTQRAGALAEEGRAAPASETVRRGCRTSSSDAARVTAAAETAAAVPMLGAAVESGVIGLEHVNGYGDVARTLGSAQQDRLKAALPSLLNNAEAQTPEEFRRALGAEARKIRVDDGEADAERQRRDRKASFGMSLGDGMGWLSARFDPETSARVHAHLSAERDRLLKADPTMTHEHATADALANLLLGGGRSERPGVVEVVAFIDFESLLHGAHAGGVSYLSSGVPVPVSQIRRLCCEAKILPMVLDGEGRPLDVGREQRLATREQRRALRKLHKTCAFPECETPFDDCEVHHVHWWELFGPTDLANMAPLCARHHHLCHEGGWQLSIDKNRTITVRRPDGTPWCTTRWAPPDGEHPRQSRDTLTRRRSQDPPTTAETSASAPRSTPAVAAA